MTTIRRKYSLPNCTLFVEGLGDPPNEQSHNVRPVISMLVNAECHIAGAKQPLTGGREFFESLVNTVSGYAQEFLSKVPHPEAHNNDSGLVQLQQIDRSRHRLIVHANEASPSSDPTQVPIAIELTTVQLFDLVEAVDQFFADSQTIPAMSLQLVPVSKRYAGHTPQLTKQAAPAAIGVSSLALAAIAFFFVPIPEVRRPEEPQPQSGSSSGNLVSAITDTEQIATVQQLLYNRINRVWQRSTIPQDLIYRVSTTANGAIVGYRSIDAIASDAIEQTPLPDLLVYPVTTPDAVQEAIAQFRVVFGRNGMLQVTPWQG
ncbi:DUF4335 domain-containing protein [Gloeocapsopsis dulcis]|uniref:DUF4335 domain-containing protein n=1 Tax=Gloeocapsopsis dulcis AAB1 = 1H9 TaxID=1433147 RepID=A0A6N8FWD5_9CHRO|nr:DUF4335 domain-containing protein [Gloeocapsopsis dulcis]MUL37440.1 hypothetical protein [Gloeocapsopsis dulcis AAB1 = 1H9]WNN87415.1 DUF4335 domain-containing protein [Gloeocapsopsis dulcis]